MLFATRGFFEVAALAFLENSSYFWGVNLKTMYHQEQLLHYVWQYRLFPSLALETTNGQHVEVIDPGTYNSNAGPDFFNAKIRIGDAVWAGDVELHHHSGAWVKHGHHRDAAYNSVILHVVEEADCMVENAKGEAIPQCILSVPHKIRENADYLIHSAHRLPCREYLPLLPKPAVDAFFTALSVERLERKTGDIFSYLKRFRNSWDEAFYLLLTRNFGFGLNSEAFERLALSLPYHCIRKHSDNLFQLETMLFGQAGMLEDETVGDDYYRGLRKEYAFLKAKYALTALQEYLFKRLRIRPQAFPTIRMAQLAALLQSSGRIFSAVIETEDIEALRNLFKATPSPYWQTHYTFGKTSPFASKQLGQTTIDILLINTVSPILFAYGRKTATEHYCDRAVHILESLKPERNAIVDTFRHAGMVPTNAFNTQAMIQLRREYCDKRKCLFCRIGYMVLTHR